MIKARTKLLILALTALLSISIPLGFLSSSFANSASYNNVQIFIQPASSLPDYFTVSAFNMSGYMETSCQTQYPAASFELPNGQYIFTATADQSSNQIYYPSAPITDQNVVVNGSAIPYYEAPVVEYGYSVQQVSSSTTFTISTQNVSSYPTTALAIKVAYANGTSAEDASVSASVIGSSYYWGYESTTVMWNTTQTDGIATLVIPQAPVRIDAWSWIPVDLPTNQTVIPVIIAGENVNVTVYWQPTNVGLAGSATIVPPQTSATITLHVQQSDYWVMPYGVQATSTNEGQATSSSTAGSIPATVYQQQQGNPVLKNYQSPTSPSSTTQTPQSTSDNDSGIFNGNTLPLIIVTIAALAVAATSLVVTARIHGQDQKTKSSKTEPN